MEQLQDIMTLFGVINKEEITDEEALKLGKTYFNMMKQAMKISPDMMKNMEAMTNIYGNENKQ